MEGKRVDKGDSRNIKKKKKHECRTKHLPSYVINENNTKMKKITKKNKRNIYRQEKYKSDEEEDRDKVRVTTIISNTNSTGRRAIIKRRYLKKTPDQKR